MKYFDKIPDVVKESFKDRAVDPNGFLYGAVANLDGEGRYADVYVCVDSNKLYVLSGYAQEKLYKRKVFLQGFDVLDYSEYELLDIEEAKVERYLSTAHLIIKINGEERDICRFSIGLSEKFDKFAERIIKIKKNEPIDDSKIKDKNLVCPKCGMRYPDRDRQFCPNCLDKGSIFLRLCKMFFKYKKEVLTILALIVLSAGFGVITPYFGSKVFYDDVLNKEGRFYGMILQIVLVMAIIRLISVLLSVLFGTIVSRINTKTVHDIRTSLFSNIGKLSLGFFTNKQTGSLMSRIDNDANQIYGFFTDIIPYALTNVITLIGTLIVMYSVSPFMATVLLIAAVIMGIFTTRFGRKQRKLYRRWHIAQRSVTSVISDSLNGQRVVKAFAKEDKEIERFDVRSTYMRDVEYTINTKIATTYPKIWIVYRIANVILWLIGGYLIINKLGLEFGGLIAVITYSGNLYGPIEFFLTMPDRINRCIVAGARVFEILDAQPSVKEAENPVYIDRVKGDICLKNVVFEYEPGRPVIKDVSFNIEGGKFFGIVGKTGAGKSTIINLISRLYDTKDGSITIDGVDIKDISFKTLKDNIGVVTQETYLFMGSIFDNIRYARPDATIEEVIAAAKAAYAHDFIMKQPDGYDTLIGSGNSELSGGEKQRISIARAIIQNPAILILDEATAAMDTQTENNIQQAIEKMREGRTVISIAHRLSTLRDADVLAVIDDGKLVEMGTHMELINKKGDYYELYKVQSEALKFIGIGE